MTQKFPADIPGQMVHIMNRLGEIERRMRNRKRTGKITEVDLDKGLARVELSRQDGEKPYVTGWVPWKEIAAGGIKSHVPPTKDEQVEVVSENGDLTDAVIEMSTNSDDNPRPHNGPEMVIKKGNSRFFMADDVVIITSPKIILRGEVHLGDEGGKLVHRKDDVDSGGDAAVGSASQVYAI